MLRIIPLWFIMTKLTRRQLEWGARLERALALLDRAAPWLIPFVILPSWVAIVVLEVVARRAP